MKSGCFFADIPNFNRDTAPKPAKRHGLSTYVILTGIFLGSFIFHLQLYFHEQAT
jgi:hypothetical protein